MSGEVYFGHHINVALGGIAHYIAHLILRVEALYRDGVVFGASLGHYGMRPLRAYLSEQRTAFDFGTPALVVG